MCDVNLTGTRFGKLTTIEIQPIEFRRVRSRGINFYCKCDCGNFCTVAKGSLLSGATKSCGCGRTECRSLYLDRENQCLKRLHNSLKQQALKFGRRMELNFQQLALLVTSPCSYCGSPPSNPWRDKLNRVEFIYLYTGIDRVNSLKDYTFDNCVSACWQCNCFKSNDPVDIFKIKFNRVANNFKSTDKDSLKMEIKEKLQLWQKEFLM